MIALCYCVQSLEMASRCKVISVHEREMICEENDGYAVEKLEGTETKEGQRNDQNTNNKKEQERKTR